MSATPTSSATGVAARYARMAQNNRWSNYRLHGVCAQLSFAELRAPRTSFFPSLHATLTHIVLVDRYYLNALTGGALGRSMFADKDPYPDFERLTRDQFAADLGLIAWCDGLTDGQLRHPVGLERAHGMLYEPTENVLLHLFIHQIHHRGQVHAMLSGTALAPPQLDEWFMDWDLPVRAAEIEPMLLRPHA